MRLSGLALFALLLVGTACAHTVDATGPPVADGEILAAWVQLPPSAQAGGQWLARAVVDDATRSATCPTTQAGAAMQQRAVDPDAGLTVRYFPVIVCEIAVDPAAPLTLVPAAGASVTFAFLPYAAAHLGDEIAVVADSGCRGSLGSNPQDCATEFPLAAIATAAAADAPSAVVHLGDYLYRKRGGSGGGGCGSGDDPCDTWANWRDDFFAPAAPLLAAAPWALSRGNHETCGAASDTEPGKDGGLGWFFLLAPESAVFGATPTTCASPDPYDAPYAVDLGFVRGTGAAATPGTLRLLMLDSSTGVHHDYSDAFDTLDSLAADAGPEYWFVTHEPYLDMDGIVGVAAQPQTQYSNPAVFNAYLGSHATQARTQLALAGHIHLGLQALVPDDDLAPMLIVGSSGVNLYGAPSDTSATRTCDYNATNDWGSLGWMNLPTLHIRGLYTYRPGYVVATPDPAALWTLQMADAAGTALPTCTVLDHLGGHPVATLDCDWSAVAACTAPN